MKLNIRLLAVSAFSVLSLSALADKVVTARFITNPSFEKGLDGWTVSNLKAQTNTSFTKKAGNTYLEKWTDKGKAVGSGSVKQTLSNLPAGNYKLVVAAQNIQQGSDAAQTGALIYAGSTSNATTVTAADNYELLFTTNGADLTIGFQATNASGNWIAVDNFRLTYINTDVATLQEAVEAAEAFLATTEKSSNAGLQPTPKQNLITAINAAKEINESSTDDEKWDAASKLATALSAAKANNEALKELKTLNTRAAVRLDSDMAEVYRVSLQKASDAAAQLLKLESDDDVEAVKEALQKAYDAANESYQAKGVLKKAINTASRINTSGKEGAEELAAAIAAAEAVRDNDNATPEEMLAAAKAMEDATLAYRIANGTGADPTARTLGVVQGATEIFARGAFSGTAKEKGFCYSENPEPTIADNRTTESYSNNGDIYVMADVKPATVYYVRAYIITSGYKLAYGDVVKTVTRPLGNVTYDYDNAGDDATNARITTACETAVWMWNNITGLRNFHLSAHYVPGAGAGDGTADCSYGGYMRISQNTPYQKAGTVLHEGSHGQGVINYTDWVNPIYRTNGDRGDWLGPRVDRVVKFLDNNPSAKLHGDNIHMWPYGINGAGEDTGAPMLYRANALIVGALAEDAIETPNMDFKKPAYSFTQYDDQRYYLKSEATNRGLATSFLRQSSATGVSLEAMSADEAFENDSCAWYVEFNPNTCYYTFKNVATGKYLSIGHSGTLSTNASNATYQLMGSRNQTSVDDYTFAGTSYWLIAPGNYTAVNATASGAASTPFNHADEATTQRWLILTRDEVAKFAEDKGETVGIGTIQTAPQTSQLQVVGGQGALSITAHAASATVHIYSLDGRSVGKVYVQLGATATINLPRGIYVAGGQKVVVK